MRGELRHFPFVRRKALKGGEGDDDECDTRAGEQASERASERANAKSQEKKRYAVGLEQPQRERGRARGREEGREGAGPALSVRCKSKQEVNKANELGTPSLAKGRSESAATGQQSE